MEQAVIPREEYRYCLYARKSSDESSERQVMSVDSQIKEMLELAQKEGITVTEVKRESHSAKSAGERPVFNAMIEDVRSGKVNALLTWAPDRLSRNAGDLGRVVDLFDQKLLLEVRTFSQRFTNNPNEKFMLMIVGAQGKLENDQKGLNVKRGLRAKCELGLWPAPAPTGYLNEMRTNRKGYIMVDPLRGPIIRQMFEKVGNDGWSGRKTYKWMREIGFRTIHDRPIWLSNVYTLLKTNLYYGEFEYPSGSGHWYKGRHEPLISKELYDRVQKNMQSERTFQYRATGFAFTKLMRCGKCGSSITAQEKHKKLKRGGEATYVYYGCTRSKNINCPIAYLREEELIEQLSGIIDMVTVDELGLRKHLREDIARHEKFQEMLGVKSEKAKLRDIDLKSYAKHVLSVGSLEDRRSILGHLKNRLVLDDRRITLDGK